MVNLEWYRSFVQVYRVGRTVSKASESLHLTQPAVSQHLAGLEANLGTLLFQRMSRRMVPTEVGRRLYTQVVVAGFVIPELRSIRAAVVQGLGFSVLPDYLCAVWVEARRLQVILRPHQAVTNSIWLAYRKSEGRSQQVTQLLQWLDK
jgi:DNA-binding transcriptional LysR family regulator